MSVAQATKMSKMDRASGMVTVTMMVTPEQAQSWLDTMPNQRRLRKQKVERLKRVALEGRWKLLPHGVVIDWNDVLRDGQHRCYVIVETGKTLPLRVTFNVDPSLYLDIDDATTPKTIEDVLRYEGVAPGITTIVSESIRYLFREERGLSPLHSAMYPSNREAQEVYHRSPRLVEAGELASRCRLAPSRAVLCFALYKGLLRDEVVTKVFVDQLADGEGLRVGDPALLLRNTWISDRTKMVRRERSDQLIMSSTCLLDAIKGKRRQTWRGVEFGKGKIPSIA